MAQGRLNREEFFAKLTGLDEADLRKAVWTLYWRGDAPVRQRIEALIEPADAPAAPVKKPAPEAGAVLAEVREFAALAGKGAYLAGDRRVSPKERTRWRFTFRRLVEESLEALRGEDAGAAGTALAEMVDLACATTHYDLFRSEDPVEAARFVVSDAVAALWTRMREVHGVPGYLPEATGQLIRWESEYGWTRRGDGWVSAHETSLATVLGRLLVAPESWAAAATSYLDGLDGVTASGAGRRGRRARAEDLLEWNLLLVQRLVGSEQEELLDRLATHPALAGPNSTFLQAHLARERGQEETALTLVQDCLAALPGHPDYRSFAEQLVRKQVRL